VSSSSAVRLDLRTQEESGACPQLKHIDSIFLRDLKKIAVLKHFCMGNEKLCGVRGVKMRFRSLLNVLVGLFSRRE
jgi:hypothetical protein